MAKWMGEYRVKYVNIFIGVYERFIYQDVKIDILHLLPLVYIYISDLRQ